MRHTRIYLVGFMGAGKSTTGRILARRLGWRFLDLDREIERAEHQAISDIFQKSGEPHFRQIERNQLKRIATWHHVVVALGGGAFIDPLNRELANATGLTVWLKVSFDNVRSRVRMDGTRPKFGSVEQAEALYQDREPAYRLARVHIDTNDRSPGAVADELLGVIANL